MQPQDANCQGLKYTGTTESEAEFKNRLFTLKGMKQENRSSNLLSLMCLMLKNIGPEVVKRSSDEQIHQALRQLPPMTFGGAFSGLKGYGLLLRDNVMSNEGVVFTDTGLAVIKLMADNFKME